MKIFAFTCCCFLLAFKSFGQTETTEVKKGGYFHLMPFIRIDQQSRKRSSSYTDENTGEIYESNTHYKGGAGGGTGLDLCLGRIFNPVVSAGAFANFSFNIPEGMRGADASAGGEIEITPIKWVSIYGRLGLYVTTDERYFNGIIGGGGLSVNIPSKSDLRFSIRAGVNCRYVSDHGPSKYSSVNYEYYEASTGLYIINIGFRVMWPNGNENMEE